jgi:hypothetical protein
LAVAKWVKAFDEAQLPMESATRKELASCPMLIIGRRT